MLLVVDGTNISHLILVRHTDTSFATVLQYVRHQNNLAPAGCSMTVAVITT